MASIYVIAAICGNFWTESGINPGVWESLTPVAWDAVWKNNTGGYGLGQWTNTGSTHGRLYNLHQYLSSNGYADDSMIGQLKYITVENVWHKGTGYQKAIKYETLSDFLNTSDTDLNYLTRAWLLCWEGINNGTLSKRQKQARICYDYILEHINDEVTTYYSSNTYQGEDKRKHNALYIYKNWDGTIPDDPVTPDDPPTPRPGGGYDNIYYGGVRDVLRRLIIHA